MIVLAALPWLWRRVMDPRLLADHTGTSLAPTSPLADVRNCLPVGGGAGTAPLAATPTTSSAWHPRKGFAAGTPWSEVPDDWACPVCGVCDKVDFEPVPVQAQAGDPRRRWPQDTRRGVDIEPSAFSNAT